MGFFLWLLTPPPPPLCFGRGYGRVRKKSKYVITNYKITCNVNKKNNDCNEHVNSRTLITHATGIGKSTSCPPHQRTQTTELHLVSHFYQNWCQADHWLWYSNIHFYSLYFRHLWGVALAVSKCKYMYFKFLRGSSAYTSNIACPVSRVWHVCLISWVYRMECF